MKTILLAIILAFVGLSLYAQEELYFIRARTENGYSYREGRPPVQILTYNSSSDTLLQVKNDYTKLLNSREALNELSSVIYYPLFRTFSFATRYSGEIYLLRSNEPDTLVQLITECPDGYETSTDELTIIGDHWVYRCTSDNGSGENYARFKGLDWSLTEYFDLKATDYKDLYLTGVTRQRVELRPNDGNMYLPIIGRIIGNRPPFSVVLPEKYRVDKNTYTGIYVNDDHKTLVKIKSVNPGKGEDYGSFHAALYNKDKDLWSDIELKGNSPTIMTYDRWLAGIAQDKSNSETKFYIGYKISPGKAERDSVYMEYTFDEYAMGFSEQTTGNFYRPGILYLYNTETNNYIEWNTQQGDSEILLVEDEIVYYRVFNAIYKAPILNGETLGKAELLVKDNEFVPFIHWAFFRDGE